jgi:hypothetical protein
LWIGGLAVGLTTALALFVLSRFVGETREMRELRQLGWTVYAIERPTSTKNVEFALLRGTSVWAGPSQFEATHGSYIAVRTDVDGVEVKTNLSQLTIQFESPGTFLDYVHAFFSGRGLSGSGSPTTRSFSSSYEMSFMAPIEARLVPVPGDKISLDGITALAVVSEKGKPDETFSILMQSETEP